ncbi:hypothetical protein [Muribacter muris]|uniref:hypothetical protein n=1 Tax=Muribacter muris TaxID=67855 RepID=UPI00069D894C|nr:hypothetical protein [Muribacter muris]
MKKIITLMGLALLLSGCDGNEKNSVPTGSTPSSSQSEPQAKPVEAVKNANEESTVTVQADKTTNEAESVQAVSSAPTSANAATDQNSTQAKPAADNPVSPATENAEPTATEKAVEVKRENTAVKTAVAKTAQVSERKAPKKAIPAKEQVKKEQHQRVKSAASYSNAENESGLSEEELRVGAQQPLSIDEINHLKTQCRYPFMSDREMQLYRCFPVKVNQ